MIIVIDKWKILCYTNATKRKEVRPMEKKLRHSHQRERIYEYLCESTQHPSAEMVYDALRPEIPGLSLGTVYRNLKLLEELGKVRRVAAFQGTERYDAICGDHAHFLCEKCGRLHDLDSAVAQDIRWSLMLGHGYTLKKLDITITGICPECKD